MNAKVDVAVKISVVHRHIAKLVVIQIVIVNQDVAVISNASKILCATATKIMVICVIRTLNVSVISVKKIHAILLLDHRERKLETR